MLSVFNIDIADEMTTKLLPLSFGAQPDPVVFLKKAEASPPKNKAVAQFLGEPVQATTRLEAQNYDISRFLTEFTMTLKSAKRVSSADVVVVVKGSSADADQLIVERRIDPNISHPLRQKDIVEKIGPELAGMKFAACTFQVLCGSAVSKTSTSMLALQQRGDDPVFG